MWKFSDENFIEIILFRFIINNFITFKVLVSLPKCFHGPLAMRMCCNLLTGHTFDHSWTWLNRLTIQLVFNEVWLFKFCKWAHGFDVLKNYFKQDLVQHRLFDIVLFQLQSCSCFHFLHKFLPQLCQLLVTWWFYLVILYQGYVWYHFGTTGWVLYVFYPCTGTVACQVM